MINEKYCLILVDQKDSICGIYTKFTKREDLYNYLGLIINKEYACVVVQYLLYFDSEFDNFDSWISRCRESKNILCNLILNGNTYYIKIKQVD